MSDVKLNKVRRLRVAGEVAPSLRNPNRVRPIKLIDKRGQVTGFTDTTRLALGILERAKIELATDKRQPRACEWCGKPYVPRTRNQRTHTKRCGASLAHKEWREKNRGHVRSQNLKSYNKDKSAWKKRAKKWAQANPDKVQAKRARYRAKPEKVALERAYRKKSRAKMRARLNEWRRRNREHVLEQQRLYRAKKRTRG